MAQIVWTETAISDLDAIADYIAIEDRDAAAKMVERVLRHVDQLATHPKSGSIPAELPGTRYRQIVEPPCRVFYRLTGKTVFILHVMRGEQKLKRRTLSKARSKQKSRGLRRPS